MSEIVIGEGELVGIELGRIATEYREAEKLKGYMAAVLGQIESAARATNEIPSRFDIQTARGEQLTFVGRRLGFPRCHCVCDATPIFGFACDNPVSPMPIVGFCQDGTWAGCEGVTDLCIDDDEVYRSHLLARRYQMLGLYDIESLGAALKHVWGETAWIPDAGRGRVVLSPGRDLTAAESQRISITLRSLPIAPGIQIAMHYGGTPIFGFGAGWAGFCTVWPQQRVFGFDCESPWNVTGFCDDSSTWANCLSAPSESVWLCPVYIDPYLCGPEPDAAVFGFSVGDDDEVAIAGFGDDGSTWAGCQ